MSGWNSRRNANEYSKPDRVDGDDLEPNGRLHQNFVGLQELLCRDDGATPEGDGRGGLRERFSTDSDAGTD